MKTILTTPLFIFKCQNHPRIERVSIYPLVSVTLLEHLSSPPVFSEVRFTRSLVLCACFVYICPFVLFHWHFMTVQTVWYILFFTLWQFERCGILFFSFFDSSNGVVYFDFHFMTVRAVWYILFLSYDSSDGVVYFVFQYRNARTVIKWKSKYATPFELSKNEKNNIPHRSNCHKVKNKIYHTVRTVIKWKTKYTTPFELS
jgi:hypothetical protein